jgi:hypothetical protein
MSRLQQLPSDQSAVLSLLLRQRKTYSQVAGMLDIMESAVRDRAYQAIATLGAQEGTSLLRTHRQEIGDYLLGQRESLSHSTRTYLRTLPTALSWANEVRSQLQEIAPEPLPQFPANEVAPPVAPERTPPPLTPQPHSGTPSVLEQVEEAPIASSPISSGPSVSRRGGALLLGGILLVVVVAIVLIADGGGGNGSASSSSTSKSTTATTTSSSHTTSAASGGVHVDAQLSLAATQPGSNARGAVEIASEGKDRAFDVIAENLPPTKGFFYVAWLYNSPSHAEPLGKAPTVTANGKLQAAGPLPSTAADYHEMILTRETNEHPTRPGPIVLKGTFNLKASGSGSSTSGSGSAETGGSAESSG